MKKNFCILITIITFVAKAQIGGRYAFSNLNLASNARVSALGGENISILDNDPNLMFHNPSLMNETMYRRVAVNFSPYMAGIFNNSACISFKIKKLGQFGVGTHFINYGSATRRDDTGLDMGRIFGYDAIGQVSHARQLGHFSVGASLKMMGSRFVDFSGFGLALDLGSTFKHPKRDFTISILAKNVGFGNYALPINAILGLSYKLEHLPLRLSLTIHHLHRWNIAYTNPNAVLSYDINGTPIKDTVKWYHEVPRHIVLGGELILSKGFNVRFGYNHQRRADLRPAEAHLLSGFSFGFMLKVKAFELAYTKAFYHSSDGVDMLSLIFSMEGFYKKIAPKESETNTNIITPL